MRLHRDSISDTHSKNDAKEAVVEAVDDDHSPYGANVDEIVAESNLHTEEEYRRVKRKADL